MSESPLINSTVAQMNRGQSKSRNIWVYPIFVSCFFALAMIGGIDFITGNEFDVSVLYFIPLCFAAWFIPSVYGYILAVLSVLTWYIADSLSLHSSSVWIDIWNAGIQLAAFLFIVFAVAREKRNSTRIREVVAHLIEEVERRQKSELKLEEQSRLLAEANAQLHQYAHVTAHDMREPARNVTTFLEIVRGRYLGKVLDERADSFLQEALIGSRRMTTLINSTLESVTAQLGTRESADPTEADAALDEALKNLTLKISDTSAEITRDRLPAVCIKHMKLVQVFQNLIDNALKFSNQRPCQIRISATLDDSGACISVADNGPGIDPGAVEKIFEMYSRGTSSTPGSGIGLATCRQAVQQAGGRMWVESIPGSGSTFRFILPSPNGAAKQTG